MPYYPETQYTKAKAAGPGEFVVKSTQKEYKGLYVKTYDNLYYAGKTPFETGIELQKVKQGASIGLNEQLPDLVGILVNTGGAFLRQALTKSEKEKGLIKRYFVQDTNTNKIVETDKTTYLQTQQQIMSRRFLEVDWIVKGPAEDKMFGIYKYEGAESKNKKTIQALEKNLPGISTFIEDYRYFVQEPEIQKTPLNSETIQERDQEVSLDNFRKANFDKKN